jgi:hypothetical protein
MAHLAGGIVTSEQEDPASTGRSARVADARALLTAKRFDAAYYTHDLDDLLGIAGLKGQLQQRFHQDPALEAKWGIVKDWSEQARYEMAGPQRESLRRAREMLNAVADRQGILACIQQYW